MNNYSILTAFGLNENQIKRVESLSENGETIFFVELFANQRTCPKCKCTQCKIKEYKTKTIRSLNTGSNRTLIEYRLPRYVCPKCRTTYTHDLSLSNYKTLSKQALEYIIKDFSEMLTFSQIAKKYNLSITEVITLFDKFCPNVKRGLEEAICIDEFSNTKKSIDKYACIIVGFKSHKIIDILKNRTLPYLKEYMSNLPLSHRDKVKYIITDMYDGYITIAKLYFHNAIVAIDPFHYMEYLTNAVQNIRRKLLDSNEYLVDASWMGKHWRLLTERISNYPKNNMTLISGQTISYKDRVTQFVKQDSTLHYAYLTLQNFYAVLKNKDYEYAKTYIPFFINSLIQSGIPELIQCAYTWQRYESYIINSFIKIDGKRLSNGPVEGLNSRVKTLKKIYNGYKNKERFYKRIILIVNKKGQA